MSLKPQSCIMFGRRSIRTNPVGPSADLTTTGSPIVVACFPVYCWFNIRRYSSIRVLTKYPTRCTRKNFEETKLVVVEENALAAKLAKICVTPVESIMVTSELVNSVSNITTSGINDMPRRMMEMVINPIIKLKLVLGGAFSKK